MQLKKNDINKIYFLTRTYLTNQKIINLAKNYDNFYELLLKIRQLKSKDLDRDWSLFDYEYKENKIIYGDNVKLINEKEIFRGTYVHKCDLEFKYLVQIIENSGFCKRCNTQFIPKLWWNHPLKNKINYYEIKYGLNIPKKKIILNNIYEDKLLKLGVDKRILNKALTSVYSNNEIEKILQTKNYDPNNPPPASKIHNKLITLVNIWNTRPVKNLSIQPESRYFIHLCKNNVKKILFEEKYLYTWCPSCFTKFIPEHDIEAINNYKNNFSIDSFTDNNFINNEVNDKNNLIKNTTEYFYLSILGLNERCSINELLKTFRQLSKIYHPDIGGNSEMFKKIIKAKEWLMKFYKYSIPYRNKKNE